MSEYVYGLFQRRSQIIIIAKINDIANDNDRFRAIVRMIIFIANICIHE